MSSPVFSAVMCDGMGWFSKEDYKRMLLLFDKVYYLLPRHVVEFEDIDGSPGFGVFPSWHNNRGLFEPRAFEPDAQSHQLLVDASRGDAADAAFTRAVLNIPAGDRLYTWRVVNADGEIGRGRSPALRPDDQVLAHALLLNKFLLAADQLGSVPISGQPHVHALIRHKYDRGVPYIAHGDAAPVPAELAQRVQPVAIQLSKAIVSDVDLSRRTEEEILEFKDSHRDTFTRFHLSLRTVARSIETMPDTREFEASLRELATLQAWKEAEEHRGQLRSAWGKFFKRAVTDVAGAALTAGIAPGVGLIDLVTKGVPDLAMTLGETVAKRGRAGENGLYYLLQFNQQPIIRVRE
jgi:hypothetical protein